MNPTKQMGFALNATQTRNTFCSMKARMRNATKALLLMALPLATGAEGANAQTTLNFDNVADGTVLNNFYPGVTFFNPIGGSIYARAGSSFASTAPNVISVMSPVGGPAPSSAFPFFNATYGAIDAQFTTLQKIVTIHAAPVSDLEPLGTPKNRPYMEVYDANNTLLAKVLYQGALPTAGGFVVGAYETLTYTSSTANIAKVRFSSQQSQGGPRIFGLFDSMTFSATDPAAQVSGHLTLEGISASAAAQNFTFDFRPSDGANFSKVVAIAPSGNFSIANLPRKNYLVHIKGNFYLATNVNVDATNGDIANVNVSLQAGDANNDNRVDISDFGLLVGAYGSTASDGTGVYNAQADFNGDGAVDVADFGLLINSYGLTGAP